METVTIRLTWGRLLTGLGGFAVVIVCGYWAVTSFLLSELRSDVTDIRATLGTVSTENGATAGKVSDVQVQMLEELRKIDTQLATLNTNFEGLQKRVDGELSDLKSQVASINMRLDKAASTGVRINFQEGYTAAPVTGKSWLDALYKNGDADAKFVVFPANDAGAKALKTIGPISPQ